MTYSYDLQSGEVDSVTAPDGTKTSYTYDTDNGLLTKVASFMIPQVKQDLPVSATTILIMSLLMTLMEM